jgi:hypothetical protein
MAIAMGTAAYPIMEVLIIRVLTTEVIATVAVAGAVAIVEVVVFVEVAVTEDADFRYPNMIKYIEVYVSRFC